MTKTCFNPMLKTNPGRRQRLPPGKASQPFRVLVPFRLTWPDTTAYGADLPLRVKCLLCTRPAVWILSFPPHRFFSGCSSCWPGSIFLPVHSCLMGLPPLPRPPRQMALELSPSLLYKSIQCFRNLRKRRRAHTEIKSGIMPLTRNSY